MPPIYLLLVLPVLLLPLLLAGVRLPIVPFRMGARRTVAFSLLCSLALLGVVAVDRAEKSLVCCSHERTRAAPRYMVTDLGVLPGGSLSVAEGINDRGEIIGISDAKDGKYHPFLYANGKMRDLGVPAEASGGIANHINAHGTITGDYVYGNDCSAPHRAFRYQNGKAEELPMPPDTKSYYAQGINDGGQIVGFSVFTGDKVHSVLWEPHGAVVPIPDLGDDDNGAFDINDAGQVVGFAGRHAYLADKNGVTTIGDLGGGFSIALSVNNRSQVAGSSAIANGLFHAFLYESGKMHDLGTLDGFTNGEYSFANTISASGDVLGLDVTEYQDLTDVRAFLWRGGKMIDLNGCIDAGGWQIESAVGENSSGQIVAIGRKGKGYHAFLLTPQ